MLFIFGFWIATMGICLIVEDLIRPKIGMVWLGSVNFTIGAYLLALHFNIA